MSRKTRRNKPSSPPVTPESATSRRPNSRRLLTGLGVLAMVLVLAGVLISRNARTPAPQLSESTALASLHSPTLGDSAARVHVVEFLDPACETCAAFFPIVKQLMAEHPGRIRLSTRHVAFHEGSEVAVRLLEASRAQDKYWETLQALLATQSQWTVNHTVLPEQVMQSVAGLGLDMARLVADMSSPEVTQRIERDLSDARTLRVTATPGYFVNGKTMTTFGEQQLRDLIGAALSEAY